MLRLVSSGEPRPAVVPAQPLLQVENIAFHARGRCLIDTVSAGIAPGRRTVVLGANGAGKSLVLRLMHGLIAPSAGHVLWKGKPLDAAARRAQAMVFQRPVMLRRSVIANLTFALTARGIRGSERRDRAQEALAHAGLLHLAHRPARVLSGGEQQRLAIARALACKPDLLFLDEPTASLDPAATRAIEDLILGASQGGVTIVMVTHDRGQAQRIGEDALFLCNGRVAEAGRAAQVLDAPRSAAAQAWMDGRLYVDDGRDGRI